MIRLIFETIFPVVPCFLEAVIDEAQFRKVFIVMVSVFSWHSTDESISVLEFRPLWYWMCCIRALVCIFGLGFQESFLLFFWRLRRWRVSVYVFVTPPALATLQATFCGPRIGHFIIPAVGTARWWFNIIVERLYHVDWLFWRKSFTIVFFPFLYLIYA